MQLYLVTVLCMKLLCVHLGLAYWPNDRFLWGEAHVVSHPAVEKYYMERFGNDTGPTDLRDGLQKWHTVRAWNSSEQGRQQLQKFCAKAHALAGRGNIIVNGLHLWSRRLVFRNTDYKTRRIDVLSYGVKGILDVDLEPTRWYLFEGAHGYIAEGNQPDCVYYLTLLSTYQEKYALVKHVCGIDI